MDVPNPAKHGTLILRQLTIPKTPRMHPQLLPVEVPDLQHAKLRQEGVSMVPAIPARNQASEPLLVPQQGTPQGVIPRPLEVSPHHEAILEVGEDKTIVE